MASRKKSDEKHQKILRELVSVPGNKHCFDCHQRGPTYVNVTIGSFVCTRCSGILRGLTPPHRVKSISMATFSAEEVEALKAKGNEYCKSVWLRLCDTEPPTKDEQQIKDFMISKYEKKRYYMEGAKPSESSGDHRVKSAVIVNGWSGGGKNSPSSPPTPAKPLPPPQMKNGFTREENGLGGGKAERRRGGGEDPFSPTGAAAHQATQPPQPSFANFDNNPVFTATPTSPLSYGGGPISEDRYAALKDLDSLMKTQLGSPPPTATATATAPPSTTTDWTGIGGGAIASEGAKVPGEGVSMMNGGGSLWPPSSSCPPQAAVFYAHSPAAAAAQSPQPSNPFAGDNGWSNGSGHFIGGNPFKSARVQPENTCWGVSNGSIQQGGSFGTGSFQAATATRHHPWQPSVENHANPFSSSQQQFVDCGLPGKGRHHSSNPFL